LGSAEIRTELAVGRVIREQQARELERLKTSRDLNC
jgi:hypothetical protein